MVFVLDWSRKWDVIEGAEEKIFRGSGDGFKIADIRDADGAKRLFS